MPERAQRSKDTPIKKEPEADSMLGKRAKPEPAEDPLAIEWIRMMQLVQTNKRAKLEMRESALEIKEIALRLKIQLSPDLPDVEAKEPEE